MPDEQSEPFRLPPGAAAFAPDWDPPAPAIFGGPRVAGGWLQPHTDEPYDPDPPKVFTEDADESTP